MFFLPVLVDRRLLDLSPMRFRAAKTAMESAKPPV